MPVKIDSPIVSYKVEKPDAEKASPPKETVVKMHEKLKRPDKLRGSTYKIKPPVAQHAIYITINDIVLNEDTQFEEVRPFEIFVNSKNMDHFQWIVALTRIISAVFRKGGDMAFLVEELSAVFDPKGGYFQKGTYIPSIVAEMAQVIEHHMKEIGMIGEKLDPHQKKLIEEKRKQLAQEDEFPADAQLCPSCNKKAMILMDNCMTCLNCAESKCG